MKDFAALPILGVSTLLSKARQEAKRGGIGGACFSVFISLPTGAPFHYEYWFVPPAVDTLRFKTVSRSKDRATFAAEFSLTNHSEIREAYSNDEHLSWIPRG